MPKFATVRVPSLSFLPPFNRKLTSSSCHFSTGDGPGPFAYNNAGAMSYLGGWTAVVDRSSATKGPQGELTGKAAWLAWRGAYWIQAMSVRNRISLVYHWFTYVLFSFFLPFSSMSS
jgi:NADH dehydrogenase FAD-containing subunit